MKYIITESKIQNIFSKYINNMYPKLLSLRYNVQYPSNSHGYNIVYYNDDLGFHSTIFAYLSEKEDGKHLRLLIIHNGFPSEIKNIFGTKYLQLLKEWFESVYKLPVDLIEERI